MRFRGTAEFWFEVDDLDAADELIQAAMLAAYKALGSAAIDDPESPRTFAGNFYEPDRR